MATEDDKARKRDLDSRKRADAQRIHASKVAGKKAHSDAVKVQKDVIARDTVDKAKEATKKQGGKKSNGK